MKQRSGREIVQLVDCEGEGGGGGGGKGQHRAARGWTVRVATRGVIDRDRVERRARAGMRSGKRRPAPRRSASSGASPNLRANVACRGGGRVALARLDRRGSNDRPRVARDGPRSGVETGKDSRSRKTLLPIERGGIPPRAVRAGTRGLDGFRTKRRVFSPRRGAVLRSPSLTLNIFSLLVSPDPPAGASPRLDARTTAARRARRRDEPRARVGLGRHPCRPDRGAARRAGSTRRGPSRSPSSSSSSSRAEHADPLSPVCLAPRAVRCTGAVVIGGRSRSARASLLPARRIAVQKQTNTARRANRIRGKRAPNDLATIFGSRFFANFWLKDLTYRRLRNLKRHSG